MIFEWNPRKAKINASKHRGSFDKASTVLATFSDTDDDLDHSKRNNDSLLSMSQLLFPDSDSVNTALRVLIDVARRTDAQVEYELYKRKRYQGTVSTSRIVKCIILIIQ